MENKCVFKHRRKDIQHVCTHVYITASAHALLSMSMIVLMTVMLNVQREGLCFVSSLFRVFQQL